MAYDWKGQILVKLTDLYDTEKERRVVEGLVRRRLRQSLVTIEGDELMAFKRGFGVYWGNRKICFAKEDCLGAVGEALGKEIAYYRTAPLASMELSSSNLEESRKIPSVAKDTHLRCLIADILKDVLRPMVEEILSTKVLPPAEVPVQVEFPKTYAGITKTSFVAPGRPLTQLVKDLKEQTGRRDLTHHYVSVLLHNLRLCEFPWCATTQESEAVWDDDAFLELLHHINLNKNTLKFVPLYRGRPKNDYIHGKDYSLDNLARSLSSVLGKAIQQKTISTVILNNDMNKFPWMRTDQTTNTLYWDVEAYDTLLTMFREGDVLT